MKSIVSMTPSVYSFYLTFKYSKFFINDVVLSIKELNQKDSKG